MVRKSLVGLVGLGVLGVLGGTAWMVALDEAGDAHAAGRVLAASEARERRHVPHHEDLSPQRLAQAAAPALQGLLAPHPLQALGRALDAARDGVVAAGELSPEDAKQVAKLQKKLNKAAAKQAKAQLKLAGLNDLLEAAQSGLDDATSQGDDALAAKLAKKIAKLQAKMDKTQAKLDLLEAGVDTLVSLIEVLDPNHFAAIAGLQAPDAMQVVTADTDLGGGGGGQAIVARDLRAGSVRGGGQAVIGRDLRAGGLRGRVSRLLGTGDFPLLSDFNLDDVREHVYDPSMEVLSTTDMILCFLAGTAYDAMVNQGLYVAQVDTGACESGSDGGGDQGQSSGAGAEEPSLFTVKCQRASDASEQVVSLWVPFGGPGDDAAKKSIYVRAKLTVQEGVSDLDPYGKFKLDFAAVPPGGALDQPLMHGTLMTLDVLDGNIGFSFHEEEGDLHAASFPAGSHAEVVRANVNMLDDQSQGVARIQREWRENWGDGDSGVQTEEYLLAFDDDSVLRGTLGEPTQCLSRTQFDTRVFRYTLYQAAGDDAGVRVERTAGFNVKTAGGAFGWAGYYGLWLPPEAAADVHSGDSVTRATWGDGDAESETYTVLMAPGKLVRNTRQQLALPDADGESFEWWEFPPGPPPGGPGGGPPPMPPTHWLLTFHADSGEFLKVSSWDDASQGWTDEPSPAPVDLQAQPFLQMFSQSLGGSVSFVAGDDHMTYFQQTFVNPGDPLFAGGDDVPLFGYVDCLKGDISAEDAQNGSVFQPNSFQLGSPHRYLLRHSDMTVYLDEAGNQSNLVPCTLAAGAQPQGGPFQWGMRTGPLLPDTAGLQDVFQIWNQDVFYTWETGANSWNKLTTLLDDQGAPVVFDPPLQFTYEHSVENDADGDPTCAGKKFLLQYNGPGDLFGIPMDPVDLDGDGSPDRWYPQFSIADGALMGPTGVEYVVKAIEKELTLKGADASLCADQTVGPVAGLPLPDGSEYDAPDIGPKPVLDEPPAVIDGVVQESPSNP
jgi:hypothetical protein